MPRTRPPRRAATALLVATMLVAGCGSSTPDTSATSSPGGASSPMSAALAVATDTIATCQDGDWPIADEDAYGSEPIPDGRDQDVIDWAEQFDDFAGAWEHLDRPGRVTVAFTGDELADRQVGLEDAFPGANVAAVQVPFGPDELSDLQARVGQAFPELIGGSSAGVHTGRVEVELAVPALVDRGVEDVVAELAAAFPGEPLCIRVPDDIPTAGPQPDGGDGWRLLASAKGVGEAYTTAIATDPASWGDLWTSALADDPLPDVNFDEEVAIWFGDVYGSSCDRLRLDDVVVTGDVVHMDRVVLDGPVCTADANPWAWFVAVDRDVLPDAPFSIQLEEEIPAPGPADQVTRVTPEMLAGGG